MMHIPSPQTGDQAIERAIKDVGADKYPRVTQADIEAEIVAEFSYCVGHALAENGTYFGVYQTKDGTDGTNELARRALGLLTICVLVLRNGFTVTGESACASPENFNPDIGRRIARENAVQKMWPLMGYALKDKLAGGES